MHSLEVAGSFLVSLIDVASKVAQLYAFGALLRGFHADDRKLDRSIKYLPQEHSLAESGEEVRYNAINRNNRQSLVSREEKPFSLSHENNPYKYDF
jgi:hypothetical protein